MDTLLVVPSPNSKHIVMLPLMSCEHELTEKQSLINNVIIRVQSQLFAKEERVHCRPQIIQN